MNVQRPSKLHQLQNARCMQLWVGTRAAAHYMRSLGWSLEAALWWLLGQETRS